MLFAAVAVVMAIGMAGIIAPFIPGLTIVWLAALAYGLIGSFETAGAIAFGVITFLFLAGEVIGFVLPGKAANKAGAPAPSIAVGLLAAAVGFFAIPVFGFLLGGVGGIFVAELVRTQDSSAAWKTTWSTLVGFGIGALVQLAFGAAMIITWLVWVVLV